MLTQIVAWRFDDDAPESARAAVTDALADFPSSFPEIERFRWGRNVSDRDDRYTHAFSFDVADHDALERYLTSDAHLRFLHDVWRPAITDRVIVTFEWEV